MKSSEHGTAQVRPIYGHSRKAPLPAVTLFGTELTEEQAREAPRRMRASTPPSERRWELTAYEVTKRGAPSAEFLETRARLRRESGKEA